MSEETETITVTVRYYLDAEIDGVSGIQRSGPFSTATFAANAATAMLTRSNVNKVAIVKETA